jgi:SpoVK/Ycf46/Vps4 family AAA+-type ATPase
MKSQYIKELFSSFIQSDKQKFIKTATYIIDDEKRMNHQLLSNELKNILDQLNNPGIVQDNDCNKRYKSNIPIPRDNEKGFPLLELKEYSYNWDDLVINQELLFQLQGIVKGFWNKEILNSYGLKPKQKILFYGLPGTGKTLTAKILSSILGFPLVYVRFDSIVSSYLGETASNLRKIFDFIEKGHWVVLLDEFDVVGKQRDDQHEHGEIKRVVNNIMGMLDSFNGESLIIAATNHQHLLDPGLWRRFDDILHYVLPSEEERITLFKYYLKSIKKSNLDYLNLAKSTDGCSAADINQIAAESVRLMVINNNTDVSMSILSTTIEYHKKRKKLEPIKD